MTTNHRYIRTDRQRLPLLELLKGPKINITFYQHFIIGPLGSKLSSVETRDLSNRITPNKKFDQVILPPDVFKSMNSDQKCLYRLSEVAWTGVKPPGLADYSIGPLCHARWNTTGSRILRLSLSVKTDLTPSERRNLGTVVDVILGLYIPIWHRIKLEPKWTNAPSHFLAILQKLRLMEKRVQKLLKPTLQLGAYCCHPETILQALLCSDCEEDRRFAIVKIR